MGLTDARIGTELAGYRIEALLGLGGMAEVYRALDLRLKRRVALKLLAPHLAEDERFRERFLRESELLASLDHPNVVPIYEANDVDDQLYIAMRYVEGTDLRRLLERERTLAPARALALLAPVAAALDAAHARGLVHRDVKPGNILLADDPPGHVYLSDFGLTKQLGDGGEDADSALDGDLPLPRDAVASVASQFAGTPDYLSPEQLDGAGVDARSDQYSLACVLFECLTGRPPFADPSVAMVLWGHASEPPPAATELNPELPVALDAVVVRALAKEPGDRYGSCGELIDTAGSALGLVRKPLLRRREFLLWAAAALAAAIAAPTVLLTRGGGGPRGSLLRIDPLTNAVAQLDAGPVRALAVDGTDVWLYREGENALVRRDASEREAKAPILYLYAPAELAARDGTVVSVNGVDNHSLTVVDGARLEEVASIGLALGSSLVETAHVAAGEEGFWIVNVHDNAARRLDVSGQPALGDPIELFSVSELGSGGLYSGIAVGEGAVWVIGNVTQPLLFRIDPASGQVERTALPFAPKRVGAGAGAVWISDALRDLVWRLPVPALEPANIPAGRGPDAVAIGAGAVWVLNRLGGTVSRIDPVSGTVVVEIEVGAGASQLAAGSGGVWAIKPPRA